MSRYAEKDRVNLVELQFVRGAYEETERLAKAYLKEGRAPSSESALQNIYQVLASAYLLMSDYINHPQNNGDELKKFLNTFKRTDKFDKAFDTELLEVYLQQEVQKVPEKKRDMVIMAAQCLATKKM